MLPDQFKSESTGRLSLRCSSLLFNWERELQPEDQYIFLIITPFLPHIQNRILYVSLSFSMAVCSFPENLKPASDYSNPFTLEMWHFWSQVSQKTGIFIFFKSFSVNVTENVTLVCYAVNNFCALQNHWKKGLPTSEKFRDKKSWLPGSWRWNTYPVGLQEANICNRRKITIFFAFQGICRHVAIG